MDGLLKKVLNKFRMLLFPHRCDSRTYTMQKGYVETAVLWVANFGKKFLLDSLDQ